MSFGSECSAATMSWLSEGRDSEQFPTSTERFNLTPKREPYETTAKLLGRFETPGAFLQRSTELDMDF